MFSEKVVLGLDLDTRNVISKSFVLHRSFVLTRIGPDIIGGYAACLLGQFPGEGLHGIFDSFEHHCDCK
jgi:hypothetical protein